MISHSRIDRLQSALRFERPQTVDDELRIATEMRRQVRLPGGGRPAVVPVADEWKLLLGAYADPADVLRSLGLGDSGDAEQFSRELAERIEEFSGAAPGWLTALRAALADWDGPLVASSVPENWEWLSPDIGLPALRNFAVDGGRFLTLAVVHTCDPLGDQNLGIYRLQILGPGCLALHAPAGSGARAHLRQWESRGDAMKLNIYLGAPVPVLLAAAASLPEIPDTALAGWLGGSRLQAIDDAEFPPWFAGSAALLQAEIDPEESEDEGPFGNHSGRPTTIAPMPVVRLKRIGRLPGMLIPATLPGRPPTENCSFGRVLAQLLQSALRTQWPDVGAWGWWDVGQYRGACWVAHQQPHEQVASELAEDPLLGRGRLLFVGTADLAGVCEASMSMRFWRAVSMGCWRGLAGGIFLVWEAAEPGAIEIAPVDESPCVALAQHFGGHSQVLVDACEWQVIALGLQTYQGADREQIGRQVAQLSGTGVVLLLPPWVGWADLNFALWRLCHDGEPGWHVWTAGRFQVFDLRSPEGAPGPLAEAPPFATPDA